MSHCLLLLLAAGSLLCGENNVECMMRGGEKMVIARPADFFLSLSPTTTPQHSTLLDLFWSRGVEQFIQTKSGIIHSSLLDGFTVLE